MKISERIDVCIGKCFNKSRLSQEDIDCTIGLSQSDLISKHGLNQDQSDRVIRWVKQECQRIEAQQTLSIRKEE